MSGAALPRLLALDTSTEVLAVAAAGPRGAHALNAPGGAAASAQLLPQIEQVLARAGLAYGDLDAIAFGQGPGAFTGLRTSCAVAQGLGFGLGRPLLPLDSLLVVAEDAFGAADALLPTPAVVAVAMDARMGEVYGAVYERTGDPATAASAAAWRTLQAPALYTLASWNSHVEVLPGLHGLAGSALAAFGALLRPPQALLHAGETDRAAALLRLAQCAHAAGAGIDAAQALPLYLRDKVALTTSERAERAASGAAGAAVAAAAPAAAAPSAGPPARAAHRG